MYQPNVDRTFVIDGSFTLLGSLKRGLPMLIGPPVLLVIILYMHNFYSLEYLHVVAGSAWTGMDLVLGLFFSYVMKGLDSMQKTYISMRLTPTMLFFMPAISTVTITAGVYLAMEMSLPFSSLYIIAALAIAFLLFVQGIFIFLPNEMRVYMEILHGAKDREKIVRLTMLNLRISMVQVAFQMLIILIMAHFATGVSL